MVFKLPIHILIQIEEINYEILVRNTFRLRFLTFAFLVFSFWTCASRTNIFGFMTQKRLKKKMKNINCV